MRETVLNRSSQVCLTKSPNAHNRLYSVAEPLAPGLLAALESGEIKPNDDGKDISKKLVTEWNWDPVESRKIWGFGPEIDPTNIFVDATKGVQYMNEIKENVVAGFQWVCKGGALAEEEMRGIKFSIVDSVLHADAIHRGGGQIIPAIRRNLHAAQLTAQPRIVEPVYLVDIQCVQVVVSSVYNVISQRRGEVIEETPVFGTPLVKVKAYLPVMESFGFTAVLRAATGGRAFPQLSFDHWATLEDDPLHPGKVQNIVHDIRKRKGISVEIPPLDRFMDKL